MKKWNMPEVEELSLTLTAKSNGTTGNGSHNHPKDKKEQYENGRSYNFILAPTEEKAVEDGDAFTDETSL